MAPGKRAAMPAGPSGAAKERHRRAARQDLGPEPRMPRMPLPPVPPGLGRKEKPKTSHTSHFEWIKNENKKKKLEITTTTSNVPPAGFEFVGVGNPELTKLCKELSREWNAMVMAVIARDKPDGKLGDQVSRTGFHIRQEIVAHARAQLGVPAVREISMRSGVPEPIPATQAEIHAQADAVMRDLFPRIPHTDRQQILDHAFNLAQKDRVGLQAELPLSRRVQLAVLAHIRHTQTTYDQLLAEHDWAYARRVVEPICLEIIVKWRGDEETGRDQLDEILRETIVISDSEGDDTEEEDADDDDSDTESSQEDDVVELGKGTETLAVVAESGAPPLAQPDLAGAPVVAMPPLTAPDNADVPQTVVVARLRPAHKKQKGRKKDQNQGEIQDQNLSKKQLKRANVKAARMRRRSRRHADKWEQAVQRNREAESANHGHANPVQIGLPVGHAQAATATTGVQAPAHYSLDYIRGYPPHAPQPGRPVMVPEDQYDPSQPLISDSAARSGYSAPQRAPEPFYIIDNDRLRQYSSRPETPPQYGPPPIKSLERRAQSPVGNPYQDLLVRSIEPASPNTARPASGFYVISESGQSLVSQGYQTSQNQTYGTIQRSGDGSSRNEGAFVHRRVVSDHSRTSEVRREVHELVREPPVRYAPLRADLTRAHPSSGPTPMQPYREALVPRYQELNEARGHDPRAYRDDAMLRSQARPIVVEEIPSPPSIPSRHHGPRQADNYEIIEVRHPVAYPRVISGPQYLRPSPDGPRPVELSRRATYGTVQEAPVSIGHAERRQQPLTYREDLPLGIVRLENAPILVRQTERSYRRQSSQPIFVSSHPVGEQFRQPVRLDPHMTDAQYERQEAGIITGPIPVPRDYVVHDPQPSRRDPSRIIVLD